MRQIQIHEGDRAQGAQGYGEDAADRGWFVVEESEVEEDGAPQVGEDEVGEGEEDHEIEGVDGDDVLVHDHHTHDRAHVAEHGEYCRHIQHLSDGR